MKTRHTKKTGVEFVKIADNHWQHIDTNDKRFAQVGPIYKTKMELLADHERYLRDNWGLNN